MGALTAALRVRPLGFDHSAASTAEVTWAYDPYLPRVSSRLDASHTYDGVGE